MDWIKTKYRLIIKNRQIDIKDIKIELDRYKEYMDRYKDRQIARIAIDRYLTLSNKLAFKCKS